jgi:hypothetical protein
VHYLHGDVINNKALNKNSNLTRLSFYWEIFFVKVFKYFGFCVCVMLFNANFNNISLISWRSVLLVEENHHPVAGH